MIQSKVSEEMNTKLMSKFTKVEVEATLYQMAPLKSPGLDGFEAIFYQKKLANCG